MLLTYNQLVSHCEKKRILIKDIAEHLSMTPNGFKSSIEKQTLPISKVKLLCEFTGISVEDFFGVSATEPSSIQTAVGIANTNNSDLVIQTLREELHQKNEQINSLLRLIQKQ